MVYPNSEAPGNNDDPSRVPVQTPANVQGFFAIDTEEELYEENKKLHTVLWKLDNFLQVQHLELLDTMEKVSIFDKTANDPDMEFGSSHHSSTVRLQMLLPIQAIGERPYSRHHMLT